jgi:DNA-binding transcriptional regulator YiaG
MRPSFPTYETRSGAESEGISSHIVVDLNAQGNNCSRSDPFAIVTRTGIFREFAGRNAAFQRNKPTCKSVHRNSRPDRSVEEEECGHFLNMGKVPKAATGLNQCLRGAQSVDAMPSGGLPDLKQRRLVWRLRSRGWSFQRIAGKIGVSRQRAAAIFRRALGIKYRIPRQPDLRCSHCHVKIPRRGPNLKVVRVLCQECLSRYPTTFAQRLRALRIASGLSANALARLTGVSVSLILLCEQTPHLPRPRSLVKMMTVLGERLLRPSGWITRQRETG